MINDYIFCTIKLRNEESFQIWILNPSKKIWIFIQDIPYRYECHIHTISTKPNLSSLRGTKFQNKTLLYSLSSTITFKGLHIGRKFKCFFLLLFFQLLHQLVQWLALVSHPERKKKLLNLGALNPQISSVQIHSNNVEDQCQYKRISNIWLGVVT